MTSPKPHLRRVTASSLELVRYWFEEIAYLGPGRGREVSQLEVRASRPEVATYRFGDEDIEFVRLRVKAESPDGQSVDVTIAGGFRIVDEGLSATRRTRLVLYNGSSILFGILRGMVATITGSAAQPIKLPSLNFAELIEKDQRSNAPSAPTVNAATEDAVRGVTPTQVPTTSRAAEATDGL